jgi:hypothetical protein
MKYPSLRHVDNVIKNDCFKLIDGKYVPARSKGYPSFRHRWYCAWLVFTGKADALIWHNQ